MTNKILLDFDIDYWGYKSSLDILKHAKIQIEKKAEYILKIKEFGEFSSEKICLHTKGFITFWT